jgi:uncharacterized integral membrane protein (TIGR00698 family)
MPSRLLYLVLALAVLHPAVPSAGALVLGLFYGVTVGNPFLANTKKLSPKVLSYSIIGLGASMNLTQVLQSGAQSFLVTLLAIVATMTLGDWLGRLLKCESQTSLLVSVGTAICGGSAIAAVSSAIRAKEEAISISLACVFLLNALALFIFPPIGHWQGLSQEQFGVWSAIAIHDTSSVVGSALQYGDQALSLATTTKLVRALWIVPLTIWIARRQGAPSQTKFPSFILGFLGAAALVTAVPSLLPLGKVLAAIAKRTMVLALFFIGSALSKKTLSQVGPRPFLQALCLWLAVSLVSLALVRNGWLV